MLSVTQSFIFASRFLASNAAGVYARIVLPTLAGGLALFGTLYLYFWEYEEYLLNPSEKTAGLVLGVAAAGLLLALFVHAVVSSSIASAVLGRADRGWKYFCVSHRVWRLYAAYLRILMVAVALAAIVEIGLNAVNGLTAPPRLTLIGSGVILIGLAVLVVRVSFLATPVAVARNDGPVVREAWRLSSGHSLRLAVLVVIVTALALTVEEAGELVIAQTSDVSVLYNRMPLPVAFANYRAFLPHVLIAAGIGYLVGVVLLTAAAAAAYRQIVDHPQPSAEKAALEHKKTERR